MGESILSLDFFFLFRYCVCCELLEKYIPDGKSYCINNLQVFYLFLEINLTIPYFAIVSDGNIYNKGIV